MPLIPRRTECNGFLAYLNPALRRNENFTLRRYAPRRGTFASYLIDYSSLAHLKPRGLNIIMFNLFLAFLDTTLTLISKNLELAL